MYHRTVLDASGSVKFYGTHRMSSVGATCYSTINEGRQTLSAAFNPTTTRFVTTGSTPQIHLYDVETRQLITTLEARFVGYEFLSAGDLLLSLITTDIG